MFHFNGSWLDLFYASFFLIGIIVVGLVVILVIWSLILSRSVKKEKDAERAKLFDMLNPEKRAEHIEDLIERAESQTKALRAQAIKEANNVVDDVKTMAKDKINRKEEKDAGKEN
jgi:hypothetical protein